MGRVKSLLRAQRRCAFLRGRYLLIHNKMLSWLQIAPLLVVVGAVIPNHRVASLSIILVATACLLALVTLHWRCIRREKRLDAAEYRLETRLREALSVDLRARRVTKL